MVVEVPWALLMEEAIGERTPHQTPTYLATTLGSCPAPNASAWMSRLWRRLVLRLTPPTGESYQQLAKTPDSDLWLVTDDS